MDACLRLLLVETLHAFPPALIFTGKFDPLRDESNQYAARLERAGIAVHALPGCAWEAFFLLHSASINSLGSNKSI